MTMRALAAVRLPVLLVALVLLAAPGTANATEIPSAVPDQTATTATAFTFQCCAFLPVSVSVNRAGPAPASVTWTGDFAFHPLRFDRIDVAKQDDGDTTTRQLRSGHYAFYCNIHGGPNGRGMSGEVWVAGPAAILRAPGTESPPGTQVTLDASASDEFAYANTLQTISYEFDPEGDGSYEPPTLEPTRTFTYATAGTFKPHVRVTDTTGRSDDATATVRIVGAGTPATTKRSVSFSSVATMPTAKRCVNRKRGLRITVHDSSKADARGAKLYLNGKLVKRVADVGASSTLTLRPPRGRPSVKLSVTLDDGTVVTGTVRYKVCPR